MTANFNTYIDNIETDFWRDLCIGEGELRVYDKGEEFATAGSVARYIGYIRSGTLKYVAFSEDGDEHVVGFEFAGGFVADFPFSLYRQKSRVSIVASSPCEIYCVPVCRVAEMMERDAGLREAVMHVSEALFSTVYDRYLDLYTRTPAQRYDDLLSRHPDLFSFFSLRDIASFLNITPTHLSRLRKNI